MTKENKQQTRRKIWKIIGYVFIGIIILTFAIGLGFVFKNTEERVSGYSKCIELYPLDSCELYKCRAKNSNAITTAQFNIRNYEVCKIIINNNMSFNESLDLLNTITLER